ncbi:SDR family oxidoreductase [Nocardia sp. NBC_00508]|uniref:SDR family NAD(P)-dependent oxidoreductase n=1 Tax=Nocardia sp. NBC_00508 TaxID=2975992 RepID=UPI002E805C3A|nr:SDR family NAD(P)-dependent oxidoreductase [Nocardia sp. NBC_00508]WUD67096.1 SDR family oxidoreductase [Nocardia sp. NBC_00508]
MRLEGKTAVITGSAHGIGRATAERFAREGAAVVVADINQELGQRVADRIRKDGGRAAFVETDISDHAQVDAMVEFACSQFGRIDILHNNAYTLGAGRVGELSTDDWQRTIDVCLTGYWYSTKVALGVMVPNGGGVIINTASVAALAADYTLAAYSAAKAGVINLTRVTAIDYARKGIRCNAICPGPIWTHSEKAFQEVPDEMSKALLHAVPMGRLGRPEEVANLALFLASDESSFVTGSHCLIDGGLFAQTGMPSLSGAGAEW